ncbi:hypothetical protein [Euhalothece natronophila]|nr:hypothetical protein [Euhalothece natronophila]
MVWTKNEWSATLGDFLGAHAIRSAILVFQLAPQASIPILPMVLILL